MDVMPAGMRPAGDGAGEVEAGLFLDRQRIHIGADGEHPARPSARNLGDDAGAPDARAEGDAEARELGRDDTSGSLLLAGEFGHAVDVAADGLEARLRGLGGGADGALRVVGEHGRAPGPVGRGGEHKTAGDEEIGGHGRGTSRAPCRAEGCVP
jgi:hypothetical protein